MVDTPRSMASCSTCDGVPEMPPLISHIVEKGKQGYLKLVQCALHSHPWQDFYTTNDSQDFVSLFGALPEHPGPDLQDLKLASPRRADNDTGSQDVVCYQ